MSAATTHPPHISCEDFQSAKLRDNTPPRGFLYPVEQARTLTVKLEYNNNYYYYSNNNHKINYTTE